MKSFQDKLLLQRLRLCRADMIAAIGACERPPHPQTMRELADLQLVIMAAEGAIADKTDAAFMRSFEAEAAA
jgi:hypothetical protein